MVTKIETHNLDRLEEFTTNVANNVSDTIRLTSYTKNGNPIIRELNYDGEGIQFSYTDTKDKNKGNENKVKWDVCKEITKSKNFQNGSDYYLTNCGKNLDYFLISVGK
ncbi:DUF4362 domain-containing protein [Gottfriedia acidiceleris]|uniref:DUF4362 domain-containing protein n=1 Tax=Gottfriedia acidiceleris TaxID=371036 RepID=UPI0038B2F648